jgi:glycosyltransferase involved in cell wall biosynthesis
MPVCNCEDTLYLAIRSVLLQTYAHWELILIDDGSSDETSCVARSFCDNRIRILSDGKSLGLPNRLNEAIQLSKGKYFARMDGDDVAYPERLERQVAFMEQHPETDLLGAWAIVFKGTGLPVGKRRGPETHASICKYPFAGFRICHPTYMGRLEWFRRYHYREEASRWEDQELLLRSYRFSRFANIPEVLLGYREERIDLKKILTARRFRINLLQQEYYSRRPFLAVTAVLKELLFGMLDYFAVKSRLNYSLLRHRARPITNAERRKWEGVWQILNES